MQKRDFRKTNTTIAYPWPVEVVTFEDVSDLSLDEELYPTSLVGGFVLGRDKLGDST